MQIFFPFSFLCKWINNLLCVYSNEYKGSYINCCMVLISNILDIRSLEQIHYQFLKDQCHIDILYGPFAININQVLWIFNTVLNQFPPLYYHTIHLPSTYFISYLLLKIRQYVKFSLNMMKFSFRYKTNVMLVQSMDATMCLTNVCEI